MSWSCILSKPLLLLILCLVLLSKRTPASQQHLHHQYQVHSVEDSSSKLNVILVANPTTINIFWDCVDNATDYNIEWSEVDTGDGGNETVDETESFYTIENLTECTDYLVSVEALKDEEQLDKEEQTAETEAHAPLNVKKLNINPLEDEPTLEVKWEAVPAVGNCDLIYIVTWTFTSSPGKEGESNASEPHYNITGLKYYREYDVCVTSSAEEYQANKVCETETTVTGIPEGPPENIREVSRTRESMMLEWDPPATPNGVITNYSVTWRPDNPSEPIITTATTYNVTGLLPCSSYTVSINASTSKGYGPSGDTSDTTLAMVPDAPSALAVAMLMDQSDSLNVTWTQAEHPGRCDIINNKITWSLDSTGIQVDSVTLNPTENYTITGLDPWTTYFVRVSALTLGGKGPDSPAVTQTTDEDIPGGPPENVRVQNGTTSDSISVEWDPPASPNGVIIHYMATWSPDDPSEPITTTSTTLTLTDLLPCTTYSIIISATTSKGSGPPGDISDTTEPDVLAAPSNLRETSRTETRITVSWEPPNVPSSCEIVSYSIWWEHVKNEDTVSPNTTQYIIADLSPDTQYQILVAANYASSTGKASSLYASTAKDSKPNVGAIVGGVIGGLVLVAIVVTVVLKRDKLKKLMAKDKTLRTNEQYSREAYRY